MTTTSYRAVQASKPGRLDVVERELTAPSPGKVRIRVEACGVCHSDSGTVEGQFPIDWPRVPGHELVGRIDALGSGVHGWAVGQRVGLGPGVLDRYRTIGRARVRSQIRRADCGYKRSARQERTEA